jgi:septal ring factor EnvC (AmiA/AmiB activator)
VSRLYLLLLLLAPVVAWPATNSKQQALEDVRDRIAKLRDEVEHASADRKEAADGLHDSERKISDVNRSLRGLDKNEQELGGTLARLTQEHGATQAKLESEEEQLAALLRQRYSQGGDDATRLILSGRNPGDIQRDLEYYAYIGRARAKLIEAHKATLAHLAEVEAETQARKSDLAQVKQRQLNQRNTLAQEKEAHRVLYEQLSSQIDQQRKQIDKLVRDEARLTRLVERLQRLAEEARAKEAAKARKRAESSEPVRGKAVNVVVDSSLAGFKFASLKGRLALPVAGEILARYGQARAGGGPAWKGLFIRAKAGQPVRAVGSGEVVFADWLRGFGNLLVIDHGGGYLSLYSNNESLYKQVGDKVRAGDVVATVGSTGGQDQPGLYFELRYRGQPFDPMSWVR